MSRERVITHHEHRAIRFVGNTLLNLAAIAGLICVVMVVLALVFNITLVMFKSGSMSPTMPTGSLSLVREIPAAEIKVGDVVTVKRHADLPITHRVTSVAVPPGTTAVQGASANVTADPTRIITMKGDANDDEDAAPYAVTTVRIVLASAPGLAYLVDWAQRPWVFGSLAFGAAMLFVWAFWPREHLRARAAARETRAGP